MPGIECFCYEMKVDLMYSNPPTVGRAVLGQPPLANDRILVHRDGAHG